MWFWNPSKEEIKNWVEVKEKEFVEQENRKSRLSIEDWLQRLAEKNTFTRSDKLAEWNPEVI